MFGVHRNRYQLIHYTLNIHQPKKIHKGEITYNLDDSP